MAKASEKKFALGVDYGTNSVRALIVDVADGSEVASSVYGYPSGVDGILLDGRDPNLARQNPADYVEGFYHAVRGAIRAAGAVRGFSVDRIVGIGVDTTASTPLPVDRNGQPLAMLSEFKGNLAACAWLWKDHTSYAEAAEITQRAARAKERYLDKCGGAYSSEWFWSKILHCVRTSPKVGKAAYSWVEQCDFISGFITGNANPDTMPRGICAAGHKCLYHDDWGGLPSRRFLAELSPELARVRDHYAGKAQTADQPAGTIDPVVAKRVGLPIGIPVAVGAIDAHLGAVGAGIKPGTLVKIIGTSTCDMMVVPQGERAPEVPGLCGIVPGSIVPGMYGIEAGQTAVGDIFNWFTTYLTPAAYTAKGDAHANLTAEAAKLAPGQSGLLALDWNNGNRSVLVDPLLTGLLVGQTLHTTAPEVYRALVEATAFGALVIINRYRQCGAVVKEVVNCGGIAEKSPFVMQVYADICNVPMKISRSAQTCALGAAIFGAVVGGAYKTTEAAQRKMTGVKSTIYKPNPKAAKVYAELFKLYCQMHDAMGVPGCQAKLGNVMKDLIAIRNRVRKG
jgi:L-ribulokinase